VGSAELPDIQQRIKPDNIRSYIIFAIIARNIANVLAFTRNLW